MNDPTDSAAQLKNFEDRIAAGEKIEPKDWTPERYRQQLVRMISQHAHSEILHSNPLSSSKGFVPSFSSRNQIEVGFALKESRTLLIYLPFHSGFLFSTNAF
jgi:hypothetical protein